MADENNFALPPGFVLEQDYQGVGARKVDTQALPQGFVLEQAPSEPPAPLRGVERAIAPINSAMQGASLGAWDEVRAGLATGLDTALDVVGMGYNPGLSAGEKYDVHLNEVRGQDKAFKAEYPNLSTALEIGGGVATGGVGAAKTMGAKAAPWAMQAIKGGATGTGIGGTAGFLYGEGGFEKRLDNAKLPATVGAGLGVGLPVLGAGIGAAAKTQTMQKAVDRLKSKLGSEAGAVSGKEVPTLTQGEMAFARILRDEPAKNVRGAASRMKAAERRGEPLFAGEALNSPQVYQDARYYANTRGGRNIAEEAIEQRSLAQSERLDDIFDVVAPKQSSYEGGLGIAKAADKTIERAERIRARITNPRYKKAYANTPTVTSKDLGKLKGRADVDKIFSQMAKDPNYKPLDEIVESPAVQRIIKKLREFPEYADLPDNHSKLLNRVVAKLGNEAGEAVKRGDGPLARDFMSLKGPLEEQLEALNPMLRSARKKFEELSPMVDKRAKGMLGILRNLKEEKLHLAGRDIMKLHPKKIGELQEMLGPNHGKEFRGAIRAHLDEVAGATGEGRNAVRKLIETPNSKERLEAALGKRRYDALKKKLDVENLIHKGKLKYDTGPRTETNLTTAQEQKELLDSILNIFQSGKRGAYNALKNAFVTPEDEKLTADIAEMFFNTRRGGEVLEKVAPFRANQEDYFRAVERALNAGQGGAKGGGIIGGAGNQ